MNIKIQLSLFKLIALIIFLILMSFCIINISHNLRAIHKPAEDFVVKCHNYTPNPLNTYKLHKKLTFFHYTYENGDLIQSTVTCSAQDSIGMMFFGTQSGLMYKLGNHFFEYKSNNFRNEFIIKLLALPFNSLFVLTRSGNWYIINPYQETVKNSADYNLNDRINDAFVEKDTLFLLADNKIIKLNLRNKQITSLSIEPGAKLLAKFKNKLLIAYNQYLVFGSQKIDLPSVKLLYISNNDKLYLATDTELLEFNGAELKKLLDDIEVAAIAQWDRFLFIGTKNYGLKVYDTLTKKTFHYKSNAANSILNDHILTVFVDNQKNLWIGNYAGLDKAYLFSKKFYNIKGDIFWSVLPDTQNPGKYWIGEFNGLVYRDLKGKDIKIYKNKNLKNVVALDRASINELLVGAESSVFKLNNIKKVDTKLTKIFSSNGKIRFIRSFGKKYWIASDEGLFVVDKSNFNNIDTLIYGVNIYSSITYKKDGQTFIEVIPYLNPKLLIYNTQTAELEKTLYFAQNHKKLTEVTYLQKFADGYLIGTKKDGVQYYRQSNSDTLILEKRFCMENGLLPNDWINVIKVTSDSTFWVSTVRGLAKITYTQDKTKPLFFDVYDGLCANEFNASAGYYDKPNDLLFFGNIDGLTYFSPDSIFLDTAFSPFIIYKLNLYRNYTKTQSYDFYLKKRIVLENYINGLDFYIYSLDYVAPEKVKCQMLLKRKRSGVKYGWSSLVFPFSTDTIKGHRFSIRRLPPGLYQLDINMTNHEGYNVSPKKMMTLEIEVLPFIWQTWILPLIIFILLVTFLWWIIKQKTASLLAESEKNKLEKRKFENLARSIEVVIFIVDFDGNIKWINDHFKKVYKLSDTDYTKYNFLDFSKQASLSQKKLNMAKEKGSASYYGFNKYGKFTYTVITRNDEAKELLVIETFPFGEANYLLNDLHKMKNRLKGIEKALKNSGMTHQATIVQDAVKLMDNFTQFYEVSLEDITRKNYVLLDAQADFISRLQEEAQTLKIDIHIQGKLRAFPRSQAFVKAFENLAMNALQHAKSFINVILEEEDNFFFVIIENDVNEQDLSKITKLIELPGYTHSDREHLGLILSEAFLNLIGAELIKKVDNATKTVRITIKIPKK